MAGPGSSLRGGGLSGVSRASLAGASALAVAALRTLQPRQSYNGSRAAHVTVKAMSGEPWSGLARRVFSG